MDCPRLAWFASLGLVVLASGCSKKDDDDAELDSGSDPVVVDASRDGSSADDGGGDDEDAALDASDVDGGSADGAADVDSAASGDSATGLDGAASGDGATQTDSGPDGSGSVADAAGDGASGAVDASADAGDAVVVACPGDNGGLTLPPGFCATRYAENVTGARHLVVTPAGDLFVATATRTGVPTSWVALRDTNGDGVAEMRETFNGPQGNGIDWENGYLYFAANDQILRYPLAAGQLAPTGPAEMIVQGLPATPDHPAKTVVVVDDVLYVNIGSATDACQVQNRVAGSVGVDPCTERETRAGVWKFSATQQQQTPAQGTRWAAGTRNANALAYRRGLGKLFAAQNSRDSLHQYWPALFSEADDARLPAEGIFYLEEGDDYGWPYCYYDAQASKYVLAPEYGGNGTTVGPRCENIKQPKATLPAHWAPLGAAFYENDAFPAHYRNGLFVANHGSRFAPNAAEPLPGYNVVFIPFNQENATGPYERFAEGFAGAGRPLPDNAAHRPVGVAVGNDGALFVSDDKGGTIWRIAYRAP